MISPELHAQIRRLFFAEHWRVETIATQLGVHHDTVRRAVESERFIRPGRQVRPSLLDPFKAFITATLSGIPGCAPRACGPWCASAATPGRRSRSAAMSAPSAPRRAPRPTCAWTRSPASRPRSTGGNFGPIRVGSTTRLLSCFALVLSWSRACYARFALDQTLESVLRGHVEAFAALQGVPRTILYDNLKSVVLERVGDHIRFHPRVLELAGHYHYAPQPCAVARGNEKGRVERFLGFLRHSFFAARSFRSVEDLNAQLTRWIAEVAHARLVPGRRDQSVMDALAEEQPRLLPLPEPPFPCQLLRAVSSGKTPYIRFDGTDYSIPHMLVRRPLLDPPIRIHHQPEVMRPEVPDGDRHRSSPAAPWPLRPRASAHRAQESLRLAVQARHRGRRPLLRPHRIGQALRRRTEGVPAPRNTRRPREPRHGHAPARAPDLVVALPSRVPRRLTHVDRIGSTRSFGRCRSL
jgi:transposase